MDRRGTANEVLMEMWRIGEVPACDHGMTLGHYFIESCVTALETGDSAAFITLFDKFIRHRNHCDKCNQSYVSDELAEKPITRKPHIEERVAVPGHAAIFIIKSVDESTKTVDADMTANSGSMVRDIPWKMLTFID
jgi:hypothetical protein